MGGIKYSPPNKLPEGPISEQEYQKWRCELEMYLSSEDKFAHFFPGQTLQDWLSGEEAGDERLTAEQVEPRQEREPDLAARNRHLKMFLSLIAKCVSDGHHTMVMQHSTSLESIFEELRKDYDIQAKGIHFLNLIELKYDESSMTPIAFYNQYRTIIINNLKKTDDVVKWKRPRQGQEVHTMQRDEQISPTFDDFILLQVLTAIDARLPAHIRQAYAHKMGREHTLMDFKNEIFVNIKLFKKDMEEKEHLTALRAENAQLSNFVARGRGGYQPSFRGGRAYRGGNYRGSSSFNFRGSGASQRGGGNAGGRGAQMPGPYPSPLTGKPSTHCGTCYHLYPGRKDLYASHNKDDATCPSKSFNNNIELEGDVGGDQQQEEAQEEFWYPTPEQPHQQDLDYRLGQVKQYQQVQQLQSPVTDLPDRLKTGVPLLTSIKPEPFQFLTVYADTKQTNVIHLMLDSGANVSFIRYDAAKKLGFKMLPCSQLSTLGDGEGLLGSMAEIDEVFYRNSWSVRFQALVVPKLQSDFIAGLTFMKDNQVIQDVSRKTISIHDKKYTVMATAPEATMPVQPQGSKIKPAHLAHICAGTNKVLLPGQELEVPTQMKNGQVVLVEGWHSNDTEWPEAHLCQVVNQKVSISNDTQEPISLGKKGQVNTLKISQTELEDPKRTPPVPASYYQHNKAPSPASKPNNIEKISWGKDIPTAIRQQLDEAHTTYGAVFDESLKNGYNGAFGPFVCKLNWANETRPQSNKVRIVNYDHELKGLMQQVMDDLTEDGVLADPQQLQIPVQSICSSFLRRKKKAAGVPKHLLTKSDVRLIINFSPINDLTKNIPSAMPTPEDVFITLGRFKFIISFDLHSGFFQNHMSPESYPWLGVMSPFGGVRVMTRSGQGLLGMSEQFNLLMRQILKEELQAGQCAQLQDDIIVGGASREEATANYISILEKLHRANLKVSAEKTFIFPQTADILGWNWQQGGKLEPSPHRRNALTNMKQDDIKQVKDMRSWLGLYKTLRIATPRISNILDPLEKAVADKESKDPFPWTHDLEMHFREAKRAVQNMHTLYLPSPDEELCLDPDGARQPPGIGHVLYAIKNGEKVPVRFHSAKLPEHCQSWQPCEIEALGFAMGIESEYDLIRESKHPLKICPDSKVVADAMKLIKQGKYSTSSRINKFLTNINRVHLDVVHISGKAKLNKIGDNQSRHTSECNSDLCTVCKFVNDNVEGVLDAATKLAVMSVPPVFSLEGRQAWRKAQESCNSCKTAKSHLKTGKLPSNKVGKESSNIRQYCREAVVSKDDLLVVRESAKEATGGIPRERIVVPQKMLPTLLYHLHTSSAIHPLKTQLRQTFQRSFYAINLDSHLTELYDNCYPCSILRPLPKAQIPNESKATVNHPHEYFHADVIRRAKQCILLLVDHFSSYHVATLIPSEKACDLKEGIISLSTGVRHPYGITIKVDNAKGFESLLKNDKELKNLGINIILSDVLNKNSNAVVDKSCQEIEQELRKISPDGKPITQASLAQAVLEVNKKLRRGGSLTAYEIHTARDAFTGKNLDLDDVKLREAQLAKRTAGHPPGLPNQQTIEVGDTVVVSGQQPKHTARDTFVVTGKDNNTIHSQKILRPLGDHRLMNKTYSTDAKRLIVVHKKPSPLSDPPFPIKPFEEALEKKAFEPICQDFWNADSDSDSSSEEEFNLDEGEDPVDGEAGHSPNESLEEQDFVDVAQGAADASDASDVEGDVAQVDADGSDAS